VAQARGLQRVPPGLINFLSPSPPDNPELIPPLDRDGRSRGFFMVDPINLFSGQVYKTQKHPPIKKLTISIALHIIILCSAIEAVRKVQQTQIQGR